MAIDASLRQADAPLAQSDVWAHPVVLEQAASHQCSPGIVSLGKAVRLAHHYDAARGPARSPGFALHEPRGFSPARSWPGAHAALIYPFAPSASSAAATFCTWGSWRMVPWLPSTRWLAVPPRASALQNARPGESPGAVSEPAVRM